MLPTSGRPSGAEPRKASCPEGRRARRTSPITPKRWRGPDRIGDSSDRPDPEGVALARLEIRPGLGALPVGDVMLSQGGRDLGGRGRRAGRHDDADLGGRGRRLRRALVAALGRGRRTRHDRRVDVAVNVEDAALGRGRRTRLDRRRVDVAALRRGRRTRQHTIAAKGGRGRRTCRRRRQRRNRRRRRRERRNRRRRRRPQECRNRRRRRRAPARIGSLAAHLEVHAAPVPLRLRPGAGAALAVEGVVGGVASILLPRPLAATR